MTGAAARTVQVLTGRYAIGRGSDVLTATLGSCVGIALLWRPQGLCALAHCLLPAEPDGPPQPGARFVDQALRTLLAQLQVPPRQRDGLEIHLAGGASMVADRPSPAGGGTGAPRVGALNAQAAVKALARRRLSAQGIELGGCLARRISVDCSRFEVRVEMVPRSLGLEGAAQAEPAGCGHHHGR